MSKSTSKEYELVNAGSADIHVHEEDDGVWMSVTRASSHRAKQRRRRRKLFVLILCALVVVIIVSCGTRKKSKTPAATEATSNQDVSSVAAPPTTSAPTLSPTASPQTTSHKPSTDYNCEGDRIQNGVKLKTNHFICDTKYYRYRFGMDANGSLIFADDAFNMTAFLYNGIKGDYFKLWKNGTFTVSNSNGTIVWQKECSDEVSFSPACLPTHHKTYDCPYLHLHGGGTIVMNWINDQDEWKERSILHMFNFPTCHDHFFCYPKVRI